MSLLLLFFAGRDLAFLQWYRLGESRRPEVAAVVFISLAYTIPTLVLSIVGSKDFNSLFMPAPNAKYSMEIQIVPSLIQFAAMTALVILRYRAQVKPAK
jgi:hypothetical protein